MRFAVIPTISCFILHDTSVLLMRRHNTAYMPGRYCLPGGHVEAGETLQQATVREVFEETGLQIDEKDLELFHINQTTIDGQPYIRFVFRTRTYRGDFRLSEPDKFDDIGFFETNNVPDLTPTDQIVAQHRHSSAVTFSSVIEANNQLVKQLL